MNCIILSAKKTTLLVLMIAGLSLQAQQAWFADGYHGGIYGHYPMWQAKFMVDQLRENPDWAINLEIEPETWDSISVKDAENFSAFQEYYDREGRRGRIEFVNPAWAQPYCYNISGESIIRQFAYGIAKIREYFPRATFHTYAVEEPCFTSSLPQILKGFGFKYAVLRNPNTCWGGYTSAFGKDLVNWIGPDGTAIPAVPRYGCEELSAESTWQTESCTNSNEFIKKCFAEGIQFPVGMCLQDAGWDGGPWHNKYEPTSYTTWTNYIEKIKDKVDPDDWRFSQEDLKPGLVWGAQVVQQIARKVRESENLIITAEKMAAMDYLFHGRSWPEADFAKAWRSLMLAQHHDCWIVPYNGKPGNTWADKVTLWTSETNQIANNKIYGSGNDSGGTLIRVYNTHGYRRKGMVELIVPDSFREGGFMVSDANGKSVSLQVLQEEDGSAKLFFEAEVPGMGYTTYRVTKDKKTQTTYKRVAISSKGCYQIETDYYSVTIDPAHGGTITSLIDKKNGNRQLVQQGRYLNDIRGYFYKEDKFSEGSDHPAIVSIEEEGEIFIRLKVKNQIGGHPYYQLLTFYRNSPLIDFLLHIDWNSQPKIGAYDHENHYKATDRNKAFYNDAYKLHLQFHLKEVGRKIYKNAPFDVCESQLKNTLYSSWDSIKHNVILNWVDVTNEKKDYGVALFSDHTTSYLQSDNLPLGLTVQYTGKALWGRNYKVHGPTEIEYALFPHSGDWKKGSVQKASLQWNEPMIARFITEPVGLQERSLLETVDDNLEISSVVVEDDNLIVRIYNSSVENRHKIIWNCNVDSIEQTDLNGKCISELPFVDASKDRISTYISIPQFGFVTLKLTGVKAKK